jgi:predicted small metal-binding protein
MTRPQIIAGNSHYRRRHRYSTGWERWLGQDWHWMGHDIDELVDELVRHRDAIHLASTNLEDLNQNRPDIEHIRTTLQDTLKPQKSVDKHSPHTPPQ